MRANFLFAFNPRACELLIIMVMAKRAVTMLFLYPASTFGFSFNTGVKIIKPTTTELPKSFH